MSAAEVLYAIETLLDAKVSVSRDYGSGHHDVWMTDHELFFGICESLDKKPTREQEEYAMHWMLVDNGVRYHCFASASKTEELAGLLE